MHQQGLACGCQAHAPPMPLKQALPEVRLKQAELTADAGLAQVQSSGCAAHTAAISHPGKRVKLSQVHDTIYPF